MHATRFASITAALVAASAAWGQSPGDECSNPIPITGALTFQYDPAAFTTSAEPFNNALGCFPIGAPTTFVRDAWFCWTADCTGTVTISSCVPAAGGTRIAMWVGCQCPGDVPPHCCSDDGCGPNALLTCDVVCGQQYLIRVGSDPGTQPVVHTIGVDCAGQPCPPPVNPAQGPPAQCETCCQGAPAVAGFNGRPVVLGTDSGDFPNSPWCTSSTPRSSTRSCPATGRRRATRIRSGPRATSAPSSASPRMAAATSTCRTTPCTSSPSRAPSAARWVTW
ncbi:MAG: hypothetical protein U0574_05965 [Phycisphaerales bacterium]